MTGHLYLDHNATTPVLREVLEAMLPWLGARAGNPSSAHPAGEEARDLVESARSEVARLVGARAKEITFTSGGTEATNTALRAALAARADRRAIVTSAVEHSATLEPLAELERLGYRVVRVGVDGEGRLDRDALFAAIDQHVALVTLQTANNETGALFDLTGVAAACRAAGAILHVDAVQSLGKVPLDLRAIGADFASLSSHKLHGPKGVGALYAADGREFEPLLRGGPQESRRRAGTENVPGIAGFARAAAMARTALASGDLERVRELRDRFESALAGAIPGVVVHAHGAPRLPNTANVAFPGLDAEELLGALGAQGLCASAGSACHAAARQPSHVLVAMALPEAQVRSALRFSLGRTTTAEEIERALEVVVESAAALRGL
ncbi:MAG: cysteine desulfurase family protein [Planctomycetota bacterium]|nr:cysteine desulfurase family protein [Planctomycetota bacterium]